MRRSRATTKTLCCAKCGTVLTRDDSKEVGLCAHCGTECPSCGSIDVGLARRGRCYRCELGSLLTVRDKALAVATTDRLLFQEHDKETAATVKWAKGALRATRAEWLRLCAKNLKRARVVGRRHEKKLARVSALPVEMEDADND